MAFTPSQLALLMDLVGRHKENMTRKTLKCLEMSLESKDRNGYEGRFRCAHCDNEYTSIEMSDPELKYLKQIIVPYTKVRPNYCSIYGAHVVGYHHHIMVAAAAVTQTIQQNIVSWMYYPNLLFLMWDKC